MTQLKQGSGLDMATISKLKEPKEGETVETKGSPESTPLKTVVPETLMQKLGKNSKTKSPLDVKGNISVRPYLGVGENMGLENYGFVLFPGTAQEEQLACLEQNGVMRFITGLDEYAPEVQNIADPEMRASVIYNIRVIVADLEKRLATNIINIEDPEFWNKVKKLKPDNFEFWSGISLRCSNEPLWLNPQKDPFDLIKLMAIEAGGFDIIAKSYEDAVTKSRPPKFYLDKEVDTVAVRTEYKKLRNKATGLLDDLMYKNPKKFMYVAKVVDINSTRYKYATPIDTIYDLMDEYIQGNNPLEKNKTRAAKTFIEACELDMATLKLKAMVKDAAFYKIIQLKVDGRLYHMATNMMLGGNVSDVVLYLKNPVNEDVLKAITLEVEAYWKQ